MRYIKVKVSGQKIPKELFFVEYYLGQQLCRYFGLAVNNCTPHCATPTEVYCNMFFMIRKYQISCEELVTGSVGKIYQRIIFQANERLGQHKFYRILSVMLPSYLTSFNYKLHITIYCLLTQNFDRIVLIIILVVIFVW